MQLPGLVCALWRKHAPIVRYQIRRQRELDVVPIAIANQKQGRAYDRAPVFIGVVDTGTFEHDAEIETFGIPVFISHFGAIWIEPDYVFDLAMPVGNGFMHLTLKELTTIQNRLAMPNCR